jgi:hypothetical protein
VRVLNILAVTNIVSMSHSAFVEPREYEPHLDENEDTPPIVT